MVAGDPPWSETECICSGSAMTASILALIDRLSAATERTIALLRERRAALIAAAATGQIEVGRAAACQPSPPGRPAQQRLPTVEAAIDAPPWPNAFDQHNPLPHEDAVYRPA